MKTTNVTTGQDELTKLTAKLEADRAKRLKDLEAGRLDATTQLKNAEKLVIDLRQILASLTREIEAMTATTQPVEAKPSGKRSAEEAVYMKLASEPGRRFSAAELEPIAGGRKIRLIVWDWNDANRANHEKQIHTEGGNKNRRYFV